MLSVAVATSTRKDFEDALPDDVTNGDAREKPLEDSVHNVPDAMRLLTEKYEEKLNRLETRLSEMEGLIATSVKEVEEDAAQLTDEELDRLDREEPVDGLDRESAPEDTDDGQLQVEDERQKAEEIVKENLEDEEEEEIPWLDDYLRENGIEPPKYLQRQQPKQQEKQQQKQILQLRLQQEKQHRRVKRAGYYYPGRSSGCLPGGGAGGGGGGGGGGTSQGRRGCAPRTNGVRPVLVNGNGYGYGNGYASATGYQSGYGNGYGNSYNYANGYGSDPRRPKCVRIGSNGAGVGGGGSLSGASGSGGAGSSWSGSSVSGGGGVINGNGYVIVNPDQSGQCPRGCRKVWVPAGAQLPGGYINGGGVVGGGASGSAGNGLINVADSSTDSKPQDACLGDGCKCPPGTTGIQPFCRAAETGSTSQTGGGLATINGGSYTGGKPLIGGGSVHGPFRGGSNDQCAIVQCPPGPAGAAGPPGPAGPPGLAGLQGLKGESGEFNYANDGTPLPLQSDQGYASDEGVATHKPVGFTAYLTQDLKATLARPIVFQETMTNVGRHFNTKDGKFTAPVPGLYHFEFHVMYRQGTSSPVIDLMKNSKSQASAWKSKRTRGGRGQRSSMAAEPSGEQFLHNSALLELDKGDTVWLQLYWNAIVGGRFLKPTTFTGFLVGQL